MVIKEAPLTDLMRILLRRFSDDRCAQIASSLTFTTLLALVPIITVTLTVASTFPVFDSLIGHVRRFLISNFMPESVTAITTYAAQFSENANQLTAVGLVVLAITSLMLMFTIESAFSQIWGVNRRRPILQRLFVYCTLLTIGPLCVGASLSLSSYVIRLSLGFVDNPPGLALLLLRVASLALTSLGLALLYWAVPSRRVLKRDALWGGICAGICLEALKQGFGQYLAFVPSYKLVYGAFATVPLFLLWIYSSWLIVIAGAVLAAILPEWRERAVRSETVPGNDFFDALQILASLWRAHKVGQGVRLRELQLSSTARLGDFDKLMESLADAGWTAPSGGDTWVLARGAGLISVDDVYRLLVFRGGVRVPTRGADAVLERIAREIADSCRAQLQMTLEQLFERAARQAVIAPPIRQAIQV
jgi:membrane protein